MYLVFLLQASLAQQPNTCREGMSLSRMIDQAQKSAPPELISVPVRLVIAQQEGRPGRLVQAAFGSPLLAAAQIKNDSKKTILWYRVGWIDVHPDGTEFHKGELRNVSAGIRPGGTHSVTPQSGPPDVNAEQVIFFVAELVFSDGKHWTANEKDIRIQRD